jgi:hypothetical protein
LQSPLLNSCDGGICLPNTPLSDITSLRSVPGSPCKATTSFNYSLALPSKEIMLLASHCSQSISQGIHKTTCQPSWGSFSWGARNHGLEAMPMAGLPPNKSTKLSALWKVVATWTVFITWHQSTLPHPLAGSSANCEAIAQWLAWLKVIHS